MIGEGQIFQGITQGGTVYRSYHPVNGVINWEIQESGRLAAAHTSGVMDYDTEIGEQIRVLYQCKWRNDQSNRNIKRTNVLGDRVTREWVCYGISTHAGKRAKHIDCISNCRFVCIGSANWRHNLAYTTFRKRHRSDNEKYANAGNIWRLCISR